MIQRKIVNVSWHITQSNVIDTDCTTRQRLDELATIRFRLDTSIEDNNESRVSFFADQPTESSGNRTFGTKNVVWGKHRSDIIAESQS